MAASKAAPMQKGTNVKRGAAHTRKKRHNTTRHSQSNTKLVETDRKAHIDSRCKHVAKKTRPQTSEARRKKKRNEQSTCSSPQRHIILRAYTLYACTHAVCVCVCVCRFFSVRPISRLGCVVLCARTVCSLYTHLM